MTYILRQFYAILRQLHWLPVRQRIIFKTAVLVFKCLHGMAPPYLSTYCEPTSSHGGRRHLRCALLSPANSLFHIREQTTETAVLPFTDQSCGTVFQPNFVCWTLHCQCSRNDWKCSCSRITVTTQQLTWRISCLPVLQQVFQSVVISKLTWHCSSVVGLFDVCWSPVHRDIPTLSCSIWSVGVCDDSRGTSWRCWWTFVF